jgi:hypothetical protein
MMPLKQNAQWIDCYEEASLGATLFLAKEMEAAGNAVTDATPRLPLPTVARCPPARIGKASRPAVRVAIYSDEPILATGFRSLIATDPKLKLTAFCRTLSQLKAQLACGSLDVAVVDFTPEITAATLGELRDLAAGCKLILWTNSIEGDSALRALKFGIRGVLRKTLPLEMHRQCLHRVNSGDLWFERQLPESVN